MDAKTQWLIDNRDALWNHEKEIVDAVESAYQRGLAEGRKAGLREAVEIVEDTEFDVSDSGNFISGTIKPKIIEAIESAMKEDK